MAVHAEVRIIGGLWRRSKLAVPDREGLRPTPDRVRETLFNWLGQDLSGWHCLDAFAGSGALGLEAASRGAASVEVVAFLRKPAAAKVDVPVWLVGYDIPNEFVVGYGLDYAEDYRNLRDICVLD